MFGWPGIGQLTWQAIQLVDIPIIVGVTTVAACFIVLGNLLADLVAPFVDAADQAALSPPAKLALAVDRPVRLRYRPGRT